MVWYIPGSPESHRKDKPKSKTAVKVPRDGFDGWHLRFDVFYFALGVL